MTDTPTATMLISDFTPEKEADIQAAFVEAGFEMADDVNDGWHAQTIGLGDVNTGLKAQPSANVVWTEDQVIFQQGVYVAPPTLDEEGRTI